MSRSKKPAAPPAILVVEGVKRETSSGLGPQIHVYPAALEHDERGLRVVRHPDAVAGVHCNNGSLAWRWYRHDPHDSFDRDRPPKVLSDSITHGPRYSRVYLVDLNDAESMVHGLKLVDKRLAALREKFGAAGDFAEYVLRVASVFDAAEVAIDWSLYTEATGNRQPEWTRKDPADARYKIVPVADARAMLTDVDRIDVTARCRTCNVPVPGEQTHCYQHKEPLEQTAADARGEVH